jgi:hypothetical protein
MSTATSVETVVASAGDADAEPEGADVGDAESDAEGAAAVDVGDEDADTDSSPPPSRKSNVVPTTAGGDGGPSALGIVQAADPSEASTAVTSSRPTTTANDSVRIGVGKPDRCVGSPMPAAACHDTA